MREIASGSKSVSFTKASNGFMKGGASVRYHLVAQNLVLLNKSDGFMGGGEAMVGKSVSFT